MIFALCYLPQNSLIVSGEKLLYMPYIQEIVLTILQSDVLLSKNFMDPNQRYRIFVLLEVSAILELSNPLVNSILGLHHKFLLDTILLKRVIAVLKSNYGLTKRGFSYFFTKTRFVASEVDLTYI